LNSAQPSSILSQQNKRHGDAVQMDLKWIDMPS